VAEEGESKWEVGEPYYFHNVFKWDKHINHSGHGSKRTWLGTEETSFLHLPNDIIIDILVTLTTNSSLC
jgi:hypothetical protein